MNTTEADVLARLLDGDESPNGDAAPELRALAALAGAIERRATAPSPEFRGELRARLLAAAAAPAPASWSQRLRAAFDLRMGRLRYSVRAATAAATVAAMLATGGVAAATQMAVPGDLFYPVKTALEDVRVERARTAADRAELLLEKADTRVGEAERAAGVQRFDSAAEALGRADEAAREGAGVLLGVFLEEGRAEAYERLLSFIAVQRPRLDALAPRLSGDALDALEGLRTTFSRIEARIGALLLGCCPELLGAPLSELAFEFARIPAPGEPFEPCPCPSGEARAAPAPQGESTPDPGGATRPDPAPTGSAGDAHAPTPVPAPTAGAGSDPGTVTETGDGTDTGGGTLPPPGAVVDDPGGTIGEVIEDVVEQVPGVGDRDAGGPGTNPLRDKLEGTAEDPVGEVEDTLDDVVDELTETLDDPGGTVDDVIDGGGVDLP